ncbi:MAG TPA: YceI family protein [Rhizomicrobium sp.]|nr:YceI family protein [Rhizomicrobium sp.]
MLRNLRRAFGVTAMAALVYLVASSAMLTGARAQAAPVFEIAQAGSSIKFFVKASVNVSGTFDKWDAGLTFTSDNAATGVLDIKIQADSVDTGSGLKNRKLKGSDFFDVANNPAITFRSKKIVKLSEAQYEMDGDFTIRGVTRPEKLTFTASGAGSGSGNIKRTMSFNRKDYGINGDIPLVKIADRVDVTVDLKVRRVSGPALTFK